MLEELNILDLYSLLVAIIATLFAIFSLVLTYIGYIKFKQADKLVEQKIQLKLKSFESDLQDTLIDIQSANTKISASYQYFDKRDIDKAITLLAEAEKIYPKAYNLYNTFGYAYEVKQDDYQTELMFEKAILYHPSRIEGYNDLYNFYANKGKIKEAEKYYKKALKKVPNAQEKWQTLSKTS